jgi:AcrR family transcriptional regulator
MARTQSEHYPEIRLGILRNAAKLFAQKGYARTTIVDLANATTSSRGALYHYFDSKEAILKEIVFQHVGDMAARVREAIDASDDPTEQCRNVIHAMIGLNTQSRYEAVVLMNEQRYLDAKDRKSITRMQNDIVDTVADVLQRADSAKRIQSKSKKPYTMLLVGMMNFIYTWYDPKGSVTPDDLATMVSEVFLNGFQSPRRERTDR